VRPNTDRVLVIGIAPKASKVSINIAFKVELIGGGEDKALVFIKDVFEIPPNAFDGKGVDMSGAVGKACALVYSKSKFRMSIASQVHEHANGRSIFPGFSMAGAIFIGSQGCLVAWSGF
jgi:hypothetical protein